MKSERRAPGTLFLGQGPGAGGRGRALSGDAGKRLAKIMGLSGSLADHFHTSNLLHTWYGKQGKGDRFPRCIARGEADRFKTRAKVVVIVGRAVAESFGIDPRTVPCCTWVMGVHRALTGKIVGWIPHPSGVNRWYNAARNRRRVKRFLACFTFQPKRKGE